MILEIIDTSRPLADKVLYVPLMLVAHVTLCLLGGPTRSGANYKLNRSQLRSRAPKDQRHP